MSTALCGCRLYCRRCRKTRRAARAAATSDSVSPLSTSRATPKRARSQRTRSQNATATGKGGSRGGRPRPQTGRPPRGRARPIRGSATPTRTPFSTTRLGFHLCRRLGSACGKRRRIRRTWRWFGWTRRLWRPRRRRRRLRKRRSGRAPNRRARTGGTLRFCRGPLLGPSSRSRTAARPRTAAASSTCTATRPSSLCPRPGSPRRRGWSRGLWWTAIGKAAKSHFPRRSKGGTPTARTPSTTRTARARTVSPRGTWRRRLQRCPRGWTTLVYQSALWLS
mmetsp:Transcript_803/g.2586  ORF Transcript_803/g.2586 Transcript_803/m.2586 type:complete len:279 (-) Transcript_803:1121-1957(-)